jgi:predicted ATP-dependent endonuclease of OLD family
MIRALKLKSYKGIKEVNLNDLANINVLSGKNNSGKSSILESITEKSKHSIGILFEEADFEILANSYRQQIHTVQPSPNEVISSFRAFIKKHNGKFLYKDYLSDYIGEFNLIFKEMYRLNYSGHYSFDNFLNKVFKQDHENFAPCLINPKRKIDVVARIDTAANLSTSGDNLLNHLFYLKNQEPYSKEYKNYRNIFDAFKVITGGSEFNILPDKENNIRLQFKIDGYDGWLDANNCGLGLREVLLIVAFVLSAEFNFIQIEEPESHLHPDYQRKLLRFINSAEDKQFLISTHSSIFLDTSYVDKVFLVYFDGEVRIEERTNKTKILNELGYSILDNLISDLIILTEGPKDFPVIEEFLRKMNIEEAYDVKFWPLGGDIMSQIDLSFLKKTNKLIALLDLDPKSKKQREEFKKHCESLEIECFQLNRYALENYFTIDALRKVFKAQIPNEIKNIKDNEKLENQIGLNVKKNSRKIVREMNIEDIKDTDLYAFLQRVNEILSAS